MGPVASLLIILFAIKRRRVFLAHRTLLLASLKLGRVLTAAIMMRSEGAIRSIPESNATLGLLLLPWFKVRQTPFCEFKWRYGYAGACLMFARVG